MSDDYLWDGSGEPDPEIRKLETSLARYRHRGAPPDFPVLTRPSLARRLTAFLLEWRVAAAAAAVVLMAMVIARPWRFMPHRPRMTPPQAAAAPLAWNITSLAGEPRVGQASIQPDAHLAVGEWLETDAASRARVTASTVGQVEVEPNTRLRLVETRASNYRLALERGTIHARIWAPPRQFFVETPAALAVDLGCAYTLSVDDSGAGLLRVTFGWVGFVLKGRESLIPTGAACETRPGIGPGTPYYEDAPQKLRTALHHFDFEPPDSPARSAQLATVLAAARKRDALTLWHLLERVPASERGRLYDRLARLAPPPQGVTRAGVVRGDQPMMDLWWNSLGLRDMAWWRSWERAWPPE